MYFKYYAYTLIILLIALYCIKKIKKYKKIYLINGLDGIWLYFVNKNIKKTGLSNFIDIKKNLLGAKIERLAKSRVLYGPYSETKIINSYGWSNIDFAPKYLGTYESHIQEKIIFLSKKFKLNNFIDLGAAEGYHIISLLKKKYFSKGSAFEINKKSRNLLKKNATINGVSKKLSIFSNATFDNLKIELEKQDFKKMLFLVDIEGHEFQLFDKKFCNYFSKCFFIIEDHNFNVRNNKILSNFYKIINKNFHVEIIKDHSKKPFEINILSKFSDDEKYLMMSEGRPETMQWLVLNPK
tara:strand:+ start:618 stop:1505 length:888 start_codon:yes stop_codon:yes gene_type:complete